MSLFFELDHQLLYGILISLPSVSRREPAKPPARKLPPREAQVLIAPVSRTRAGFDLQVSNYFALAFDYVITHGDLRSTERARSETGTIIG